MMWWTVAALLATAARGNAAPDFRISSERDFPSHLDSPLDSNPQHDVGREAYDDDGEFYRRDEDAALRSTHFIEDGPTGTGEQTADPSRFEHEFEPGRKKRWIPEEESSNLIYVPSFASASFLANSLKPFDMDDKRSFSPWGGKRNPDQDLIWSWKREAKEPNMPKRVRFSPWGGKRSGNFVFKPAKSSRIVYTSSSPAVRMQHLIKQGEKTYPLESLGRYELVQLTDGNDAKSFDLYELERAYQNLASDVKAVDKRKIKFSAWGGKRSTPAIGPRASSINSVDKIKALMLLNQLKNHSKQKQ